MRLTSVYICVSFLIQNWMAVLSHGSFSQLKKSNERDPYVFNLFEMILTTLESKLKRVENMDRVLLRLESRLDDIEGKLSQALNMTSKSVSLLENRSTVYCVDKAKPEPLPKITRKARHRPPFHAAPVSDSGRRPFDVLGKNPRRFTPISSAPLVQVRPAIENYFRLRSASANQLKFSARNEKNNLVETKLDEVAERITDIDGKLSEIRQSLETDAISRNAVELLASGSESYGVGVGPADAEHRNSKSSAFAADLLPLKETVDNVKHSLNSIDRRLEIHANAIGNSFTEMTREINTLKGAMSHLNKEKKQQNCVRKIGNDTNSDTTECVTPFDQLREETHKVLQQITDKKNEAQIIKDGQTKQAKTLEQLRKQVADITSKILAHLDKVRFDFKNEKEQRSIFSSGEINPVALLQRSSAYERKIHIPRTIVETQEIQENNNSRKYSLTSDKFRHSGVIFPQKIRKPAEYSFASTSSEVNAGGYSCLELMEKGEKKSGVYHLKIKGTTYWFLQAYCDMTTNGGGWTVIQRRDDFGRPRESFNRGWEEYKHGFGNPSKEFWLGNENIFMLTNTEDYILRVTMEDFDGNKRFADYSTFKLHSEDEMYKLEIGGYSGNAGDSLNDPWYGSNLSPFSTFDKDADRSSLNCASMLKGGWWWRSCGRGLNGLYYTNPSDFTARQGIVWFRWKGWDYTLKKTSLMIKPKNSPSVFNGGLVTSDKSNRNSSFS